MSTRAASRFAFSCKPIISAAIAGMILAGGLDVGSARAGTTVYTDSTFASGSYTPAFSVLSNPGNTFTTGQCAACGDPGTAEEIAVNFVDTSFNVSNMVGLTNSLFMYDPSVSGAIQSIDASIDKNFTVFTSTSYGNSFRPLIYQGGNYYEALIPGTGITGPGSTGYTTFTATGLTASSFGLVNLSNASLDMSSNPDFAGAPLTFGFAQLLGTSGFAGSQALIDYDNFSLSVSAVPEASTWSMMFLGFAGIGGTLRRRRPVDAVVGIA